MFSVQELFMDSIWTEKRLKKSNIALHEFL